MMRTCTGCGDSKTEADFPPPKPSKGYRPRTRCRSCVNAVERVRRANDDGAHAAYLRKYRAENRAYRRNWNLKQKYGLTNTDYEALLFEQGGVCAICRGPQTRTHKDGSKWFEVDHDHQTGQVRGLLCRDCNLGLGRFKDSSEILQAAVGYLVEDIGPA